MRIVNKTEFLKLPEGTLYSEYEPQIFKGLFIKLESINDSDFMYRDLIGNVKCSSSNERCEIMDNAELYGNDFDLCFESTSRNGMFSSGELYSVYSENDKNELIKGIITS